MATHPSEKEQKSPYPIPKVLRTIAEANSAFAVSQPNKFIREVLSHAARRNPAYAEFALEVGVSLVPDVNIFLARSYVLGSMFVAACIDRGEEGWKDTSYIVSPNAVETFDNRLKTTQLAIDQAGTEEDMKRAAGNAEILERQLITQISTMQPHMLAASAHVIAEINKGDKRQGDMFSHGVVNGFGVYVEQQAQGYPIQDASSTEGVVPSPVPRIAKASVLTEVGEILLEIPSIYY